MVFREKIQAIEKSGDWMIEIIRSFKHRLYFHLAARGVMPRLSNETEWILSRCACLGNDVLANLRSRNSNLVPRAMNFQKLRVDGFIDALSGGKQKIGFNGIYKLFDREDIRVCIAMQMNRTFNSKSFKPNYFIMDDFSELTDTRFVLNKLGTYFFSNLGDIRKEYRNDLSMNNLGLLDLALVEDYYRRFFMLLTKRWPGIRIFFIHFPTSLDSRPLYHSRGNKLRTAVRKLGSEFPQLSVLDVPDNIVSHALGLDRFPYHYGPAVYSWLADELESSMK